MSNGITASLVVFGLVITTMVITTDMTSSQIEAAALVLAISDDGTTIVSNPVYSWLYNFILYRPNALIDYREALYSPLPTDDLVLISDPHFQANIREGPQLQEVYDKTSSVRMFHGQIRNYDVSSYPYSSLSITGQGELIDVRAVLSPVTRLYIANSWYLTSKLPCFRQR